MHKIKSTFCFDFYSIIPLDVTHLCQVTFDPFKNIDLYICGSFIFSVSVPLVSPRLCKVNIETRMAATDKCWLAAVKSCFTAISSQLLFLFLFLLLEATSVVMQLSWKLYRPTFLCSVYILHLSGKTIDAVLLPVSTMTLWFLYAGACWFASRTKLSLHILVSAAEITLSNVTPYVREHLIQKLCYHGKMASPTGGSSVPHWLPVLLAPF